MHRLLLALALLTTSAESTAAKQDPSYRLSMTAVGIAITALGAASGVVVSYLGSSATLVSLGLIASGDSDMRGWIIGTLVSGVGHLAVGVPLIVWGSIDETPTSSLRIDVSSQGGAARVSW